MSVSRSKKKFNMTQIITAWNRKRAGAGSRRAQAGLTILSALLALVIGSVVAMGTIQSQVTKTYIQDGEFEADLFNRIKDAQNTYALENYGALQNDLPVTKNGTTLAFGTTNGQSLAPRVQDLVAMGYLNPGTTATSNKIENGTYRVAFRKTPVGCLPATCDITGDAYIDQPYLRRGSVEPLGPSIGAFLNRVGGDGTVSLITAPGLMISANQVTTPNPVAGSPAGVIGARVGFGSSGFGRFLVVGDSRDPQFRGGTSITGTIPASGGLSLRVTGATNLTGALTVGGPIQASSDVTLIDPGTGTTCVKLYAATGQVDVNCSGILNAKAGTFTGPSGTVKVGDTALAGYTIDSSGRIQGQAGFYTALQSVFGDNPNGVRFAGANFTAQNAGGVDQLAVKNDGSVGARKSLASPILGLSDPVVIGAACGTAGTIVPAGAANNVATTALAPLVGGGLASCVSGAWTPITNIATLGAACTVNGISAISDTNGQSLICKKGVYMQVSDLLSSFVLMQTYRVSDGTLVPKPTCGAVGAGVGLPLPVLIGQVESSPNVTFTRRVDDVNASTWRVVLQDSNGASLGGNPNADALFQAFCFY